MRSLLLTEFGWWFGMTSFLFSGLAWSAFALVILLQVFALPLPVRGELIRLEGTTMGTYYAVSLDTENDVDVVALRRKVDDRLAEINRQMSTWIGESEISMFNRHQGLDWFEISEDFAAVVEQAHAIFVASDGLFDPTISPLVSLWGFADSRPRRIPAEADVAEALSNTGMRLVEIRNDPPAIRKLVPGVQLNLSAIAKGFGVDSIAELLESEGYGSYVVDIGGEDRAGSPKLNGKAWRLGVESPLGGLHQVVLLENCSIATSGDYRNFFSIEGRKFSHVIDPGTGWPVPDPPASVSVIHRSCMVADAWATALMVAGTEKGLHLAREQGLEVMFLDVSESGSLVVHGTGRFSENTTEQMDTQSVSATNAEDSSSADSAAQKAATRQQPNDTAWLFPVAAALGIFALAMAGMAIGVILNQKAIKGSCGGIAAFQGDGGGSSVCQLCTKPKDECLNPELKERMQASADKC